MRLHVPGQLTWPEPELGLFCDNCDHFDQTDIAIGTAAQGKGRCALVVGHQGVKGKVFEGSEASACPKWKEPT